MCGASVYTNESVPWDTCWICSNQAFATRKVGGCYNESRRWHITPLCQGEHIITFICMRACATSALRTLIIASDAKTACLSDARVGDTYAECAQSNCNRRVIGSI